MVRAMRFASTILRKLLMLGMLLDLEDQCFITPGRFSSRGEACKTAHLIVREKPIELFNVFGVCWIEMESPKPFQIADSRLNRLCVDDFPERRRRLRRRSRMIGALCGERRRWRDSLIGRVKISAIVLLPPAPALLKPSAKSSTILARPP